MRAIARQQDRPTICADDPQCGWYKRKLVRGGPFVPARIFLEAEVDERGELIAPEIMKCEVGTRMCDPLEQWSYLADKPITEADFEYMQALARHVSQNGRDESEPASMPLSAIDWLAVKPPEF
jgi:hypothetical protein